MIIKTLQLFDEHLNGMDNVDAEAEDSIYQLKINKADGKDS